MTISKPDAGYCLDCPTDISILVGSVLLIFLVFCAVRLCIVTFWIPCCNVRSDFRIETMLGLPLPPVVCRMDDVLFTFVCVCLRIVVSNTYCVVFLFCFSSSMLPVSLDCPFLIAPSVFSNVYWHIDRNCLIWWLKNILNYIL